MSHQIKIAVGAHEPILHRLRTGNSSAEEWARWEYETSDKNLDVLSKLGVTEALLPCTKGFGLEYEKPLVERAASFAERAAKRGIKINIYIQGFPVYYETFLRELPQAEEWLGRNQVGDYIPWGGQTFRRFMDPTREEFFEYQCKILKYILERVRPLKICMDNTGSPMCYTASARNSFRRYLTEKFDSATAVRQFGIPSFDAVDLPHFDPIYWPRDAYRIVKDPILQEWVRWHSKVCTSFVKRCAEFTHKIDPGIKYVAGCGCGGMRYNQLFTQGLDFEDMFDAVDLTSMEESCMRPGVIESGPSKLTVIMDERVADADSAAKVETVRVSTDSRFTKITQHYGMPQTRGFWGEFDRDSKLVALAHNMAFSWEGDDMGMIGPLGANPRMFDDIKDVFAWAGKHTSVLAGRGDRVAPIAVWRSTATLGFIRHTPVWAACAIEQMLYEAHLPFTILLDGCLERLLGGVKLLILPGTACISEKQVELISNFVQRGGRLLLLGESGTCDERTRVRSTFAFAKLFGGKLPKLERIGPPHWVPTLDFSRMPETASATFGKGRVTFVKHITPVRPLDLSRDVYMPERQVMPKDIVPPANEAEILKEVMALYGNTSLRVDGPRWTLCEYWTRGQDLIVCCANLHQKKDGGPVTLNLGNHKAGQVSVHTLLEDKVARLKVKDGKVTLPKLAHFCAIEVKGVLPKK